MPDYGDERGFRSRGVPADIGFDRAGPGRGWQSRPQGPHVDFGPPSNIGRDRAGGYGTDNDLRQLTPNMNQFNNLKDRLRNFDELHSYPNLLDKLRNFDEERIYQPARNATPMSYAEEAYMGPNPWGEDFPLPPGRPPIGRPPWGGGGFDIATSDEYRQWNSIRRKYGEDVANQMMGHVTANRGGIMGLI